MIKAIIFDFGDVFINLDQKGTIKRAQELLGYDIITEKPNPTQKEIFSINNQYEKGLISTDEFLSLYSELSNGISKEQIKIAIQITSNGYSTQKKFFTSR